MPTDPNKANPAPDAPAPDMGADTAATPSATNPVTMTDDAAEALLMAKRPSTEQPTGEEAPEADADGNEDDDKGNAPNTEETPDSEDPETETPEAEDATEADEEPESQDPAGDDPESEEASDEKANAETFAKAKFTPDQQKVVNHVIGKVRHKLRASEAELQTARQESEKLTKQTGELQGQLTKLRAEKAVPVGEGVPLLVGVQTQKDLDDFIAAQFEAREQLALGKPGEDGLMTIQFAGKSYKLPPETAQSEINRIDRLIQIDANRHRDYLKAREQNESSLAKLIPESADPNGAFAREIDENIVKYPHLKAQPEYRTTAAYLALGKRFVERFGPSALKILDNKRITEADILAGKVAPSVVQKAVAAKQKQPPAPISKKGAPATATGLPKITIPTGPLTDEAATALIEARNSR